MTNETNTVAVAEVAAVAETPKRKRGRPAKVKPEVVSTVVETTVVDGMSGTVEKTTVVKAPRKARKARKATRKAVKKVARKAKRKYTKRQPLSVGQKVWAFLNRRVF